VAPAVALGANGIGQPAGPNLVPTTLLVSDTGQPLNQSVAPPAAQPPSAPLFAPNLGIYYQKVPYTNGTFGAKLTSDPIPNSPASQLALNAGDIIFMMDGQRFTSPDDLLKYVDQTGVNYIDGTSQAQQSGLINIPRPQNQ